MEYNTSYSNTPSRIIDLEHPLTERFISLKCFIVDRMSLQAAINKYCNELKKIVEKNSYTEYTFRGLFEKFLNEILTEYPFASFRIIQEPSRKKDVGAPDFIVKSNGKIIGYVETKNIGVKLYKLPKHDIEQINRYKECLENIILKPCVFFPLKLANIRDFSSGSDFLRFWRKNDVLEKLRDKDRIEVCGKCRYRYVCGGCRARAYAYFKDYLAPDPPDVLLLPR